MAAVRVGARHAARYNRRGLVYDHLPTPGAQRAGLLQFPRPSYGRLTPPGARRLCALPLCRPHSASAVQVRRTASGAPPVSGCGTGTRIHLTAGNPVSGSSNRKRGHWNRKSHRKRMGILGTETAFFAGTRFYTVQAARPRETRRQPGRCDKRRTDSAAPTASLAAGYFGRSSAEPTAGRRRAVGKFPYTFHILSTYFPYGFHIAELSHE